MKTDHLVQIIESAKTLLDSEVTAAVECLNTDTAFVIMRSLKERTPWPWRVAKFTHSRNTFTRQQTFNDLTEAWKWFVDNVELFCLTEDISPFPLPKPKPRPRGNSHGRRKPRKGWKPPGAE